MFDTFVIVDWSAANQPKSGRDSIWICAVDRNGAERLIENPRTRHGAKNLLGELLSDVTARSQRVLLGFDFPFGYPAGFAQRLGLNASPPWRAVWDEIAVCLKDAENNKNDRFAVAADFNRRVSNGSFPFWGCPVGRANSCPRHHNDRDLTEEADRLLDGRRAPRGNSPIPAGRDSVDRHPGRASVARRSALGRGCSDLAVRDRSPPG
jgi:hypothetical protein